MLLSLTPHQFSINNIIISDKTKNNILENGDFYRIYYSDKNASFNGIYLQFKLKKVIIGPYFNKIKCSFLQSKNEIIMNYVKIGQN